MLPFSRISVNKTERSSQLYIKSLNTKVFSKINFDKNILEK